MKERYDCRERTQAQTYKVRSRRLHIRRSLRLELGPVKDGLGVCLVEQVALDLGRIDFILGHGFLEILAVGKRMVRLEEGSGIPGFSALEHDWASRVFEPRHVIPTKPPAQVSVWRECTTS
jgi:hypothetical protein